MDTHNDEILSKAEDIVDPILNESRKFKQYMFFWGGQLFSRLGSTIVQFVLVLWIALATDSELMLGLASIAGFGPFLLLGPFVGVLVDRLNRKAIIIIADALIAITTLVAIYLFYVSYINIPLFFVIIIIRGIGDVFHYTTTNALMPTMVPQKHLSRMNGMNYLANGAISVIGPAVAGGLIALWTSFGRVGNVASTDLLWGDIIPFVTNFGRVGNVIYADLLWADVITFVVALIPLIFITIPKVATTLEKGIKFSFFSDMGDGIRVIRAIKGMVPLLVMFMFVNFFFTPIGTLMPLFVIKTHLGTESDYAIVIAFLQAGMLVGGLVMTFFKGFKKKGLSSYIAILWAFGVTATLILVPTGIVGEFWLLGAILFISFVGMPLINVSLITAFQIIVPQESLGRTMSVLGTISSSITPIAMLLSGVIGEFVPIPWVYFGTAMLGIISSSLMWFLTKAPQIDEVIIEVMEKQKAAEIEQESVAEYPAK